MGAVFALQVRTGFEVKAKEMLCQMLMRSNVRDVKKIYALESHTEFINEKTNTIDPNARVNQNDIENHLLKERYSTAITNKRRQLEAISRYDSPEYNAIKKQYRAEINELQKEINKLNGKTKKIRSVLQGYLLIELHEGVNYLSNFLWGLIKNTPLIHKILSTTPIPEEEINHFFDICKDYLEPEVEIELGNQLDYEEIKSLENELLIEANKKDTPAKKQKELLDQIDNQKFSIVEKVKSILEKSKNHSSSSFFKKIKVFVKRKKQIVSMPLHYLENFYPKNELEFIKNRIKDKDFINLLEQYTSGGAI